MKDRLMVAYHVLREAINKFIDDKVTRMAAAIAFYAILSLTPLLLIALAAAGYIFGTEAAQGQLVDQMRSLTGEAGAEVIQNAIKNAKEPSSGILATIIGVGTLLFAASGVFTELQDSLNTIWGVRPKPGRSFLYIIQDRFLTFAMVLIIGFLLLISLVLSAVLSATGSYLESLLPGMPWLMQLANIGISFIVVMLLFASMLKFLPDVKLTWRQTMWGALITSGLFILGKFAIGLYLGRSSIASPFGAAGSLVVFVVWIYYSNLIFFFGAELTQVIVKKATHNGIRPTKGSERIPSEAPIGADAVKE